MGYAALRRFFPQQHLVRATTIACAAASPPAYAASRRFFPQQHLVRATTIAWAAASPPPYAASRRFFDSNTSGVQQRSRVRRLRRRLTPLRGVFSYAACFAGKQQHLVCATTIACAATLQPLYAASRRFFVSRRLRRRRA